jgi:hypothetical protein
MKGFEWLQLSRLPRQYSEMLSKSRMPRYALQRVTTGILFHGQDKETEGKEVGVSSNSSC